MKKNKKKDTKTWESVKKPRYKVIWLLAILSFFIIILIIPIVINEAYKMNCGYITLWGPSDVLMFYGSILSFSGTMILGGLAFYQNNKLHELNEELLKQEVKGKKGYFIIKNDHSIEKHGSIEFVNIGDDIIYLKKLNVFINGEGDNISPAKKLDSFFGINDFNKMYYRIDELFEFNDAQTLHVLHVNFTMNMENSKGYLYTQSIDFTLTKTSSEDYSLTSFNTKVN